MKGRTLFENTIAEKQNEVFDTTPKGGEVLDGEGVTIGETADKNDGAMHTTFITHATYTPLLLKENRERVERVENLSPEKFGGAAYVGQYYTPSRLAENTLFREVVTLKKVEAGLSRVREYEAANGVLTERLLQATTERDGIERTLTQQVAMYRRLLEEQEGAHEQRLLEMQRRFSLEVKTLLDDKELEVRFVQAQREALEAQIVSLTQQAQATEARLASADGSCSSARAQINELQLELNHLEERCRQSETARATDQDKARKNELEYQRRLKEGEENAMRRLKESEEIAKYNLETLNKAKDSERERIETILRGEITRAETQKNSDVMEKLQEMREMTAEFEAEKGRLEGALASRERVVDSLSQETNQLRDSLLQLTRGYELKLQKIGEERGAQDAQYEQIVGECEKLKGEREELFLRLEHQKETSEEEIKKLSEVVLSLQDEVKLNQINYVTERDRRHLSCHYLEKEIGREGYHLQELEMDNNNLRRNNIILSEELLQLRSLLEESSLQLDRCKHEILRLSGGLNSDRICEESKFKSEIMLERLRAEQLRTKEEEIFRKDQERIREKEEIMLREEHELRLREERDRLIREEMEFKNREERRRRGEFLSNGGAYGLKYDTTFCDPVKKW